MGGRGAYYGRSFVVMPSGHVKGNHKKKDSPEKADSEDYSKPLTGEALPKLEGSDKQIEWANKIRKRFVDSYNWTIEHSEKDPLYEKLGLNAASGARRLMQEGAIAPEDRHAGSTYGDEHVSTTWAKSLQIENMPMFEWDGHDDLAKNMKTYYKFLRKYANKVLKKNTSAGWWIDNFK